MLLSARSKALIAVSGLLAMSACADYMNHRDSVTLGAGNASEANIGIQTVEPFPPNAGQTTIVTPGDNV